MIHYHCEIDVQQSFYFRGKRNKKHFSFENYSNWVIELTSETILINLPRNEIWCMECTFVNSLQMHLSFFDNHRFLHSKIKRSSGTLWYTRTHSTFDTSIHVNNCESFAWCIMCHSNLSFLFFFEDKSKRISGQIGVVEQRSILCFLLLILIVSHGIQFGILHKSNCKLNPTD